MENVFKSINVELKNSDLVSLKSITSNVKQVDPDMMIF